MDKRALIVAGALAASVVAVVGLDLVGEYGFRGRAPTGTPAGAGSASPGGTPVGTSGSTAGNTAPARTAEPPAPAAQAPAAQAPPQQSPAQPAPAQQASAQPSAEQPSTATNPPERTAEAARQPVPPAVPAPTSSPGQTPPSTSPYPTGASRPEWEALLASADPARGEAIMKAGLGGGNVQACTSCHGINGEPIAGSNVPRLSGQSSYYLLKQLHDYAEGPRQNAIMTGYARLLSPQQRADVAVAWSRRSAPYEPPRPAPDAAQVARGRQLVEIGDDGIMLQACSNCHGGLARGEGSVVPYVAGQHQDYGLAALQDWVEGRRRNDDEGVMQAVVAKLKAEDRRAAAAYLATLPPPGSAQAAR